MKQTDEWREILLSQSCKCMQCIQLSERNREKSNFDNVEKIYNLKVQNKLFRILGAPIIFLSTVQFDMEHKAQIEGTGIRK